jgi:hypothetical protein
MNEDKDFIINQEKMLVYLKKTAELIKGYKITENCFDKNTIRDDTTIGDQTRKANNDLPADGSFRDLTKLSNLSNGEMYDMNKSSNRIQERRASKADFMDKSSMNMSDY